MELKAPEAYRIRGVKVYRYTGRQFKHTKTGESGTVYTFGRPLRGLDLTVDPDIPILFIGEEAPEDHQAELVINYIKENDGRISKAIQRTL